MTADFSVTQSLKNLNFKITNNVLIPDIINSAIKWALNALFIIRDEITKSICIKVVFHSVIRVVEIQRDIHPFSIFPTFPDANNGLKFKSKLLQ